MEKSTNPQYKAINEIASRIAKVEEYKSSKNPKRPEVSIGDIREVLAIISDMGYNDPKVLTAIRSYGMHRASENMKARAVEQKTAAKKVAAKK